MGTLVFQANLGGAINLIGPNTASTVNFTLPSADGTNGQSLVTNGSGTLSFATVSTAAATATTLGTVYGRMTTSGASPYLTALGYNAGVSTTGAGVTAVGQEAAYTNSSGTQNVAMGYQALYSNSTNSFSTAIGYQALKTATGGQNTAVGRTSLQALTTGTGNTALGVNSLYTSTTSANSVAVGDNALFSTTTGSYNVAVGQAALQNNTTASNNTAVGDRALLSNTTANENTAVGSLALYTNTTGNLHVAVGREALTLNTTGVENTAVGWNALAANTTGSYNVAMGMRALKANTTANYNTAVGYQALYSATTLGSSVAVGYKALYAQQVDADSLGAVAVGYNALTAATGVQNIAMGWSAGNGITTGQRNISIGLLGSENLTTGTYNIHIGYRPKASAANINNELLIGTIGATGKGENTGFINPNSGGVYQGNNSSTWSTTSDRRLKKNIVDNNIGLEKITQIQVRNFEYRLPEEVEELDSHCAIDKEGLQLGVIAQELQQVLPDCVKQESTGVLSVDPDNLTWYLINAVKQLFAKVEALESQLKGN
jgi:hypothetical protein